jgi:Cys-tRNA(Pro)/Cys-tRNA(Cys) deacylase
VTGAERILTNAYLNITSILRTENCQHRIHEHQPIVTVAEAVARVPELTENLLKTVVFRKKSGTWVLAALFHNRRVDYKKLAEAVGINRRDLRPVSPADVERALGFEIGGVGPFPISDEIDVVVDDAVTRRDTILCGSGKNTCTVELNVRDLLRVSRAVVAPISRSE